MRAPLPHHGKGPAAAVDVCRNEKSISQSETDHTSHGTDRLGPPISTKRQPARAYLLRAAGRRKAWAQSSPAKSWRSRNDSGLRRSAIVSVVVQCSVYLCVVFVWGVGMESKWFSVDLVRVRIVVPCACARRRKGRGQGMSKPDD